MPPTPRIFRPSYGPEVSFQFVTSRKKLVEDFLERSTIFLTLSSIRNVDRYFRRKKSTLYQNTFN